MSRIFTPETTHLTTQTLDQSGVAIATDADALYLGRVEGDEALKEHRLLAIIKLGDLAIGLTEIRRGSGLAADYFVVAPDRISPIAITPYLDLTFGRRDFTNGHEPSSGELELAYLPRALSLIVADLGSSNDTTITLPDEEKRQKLPANEALHPVCQVEFASRESAAHGDDAKLILPIHKIIGVFDGVGGHDKGGEAAKVTAAALKRYYENMNPNQVKYQSPDKAIATLTSYLNKISHQLRKEHGGLTTASVAQVVEYQGKSYVGWANIGDSRIYIKRGDIVSQLTTDDGEGAYVDDAVGLQGMQGQVHKETQTGYEEVGAGDLLIVCSDGITGDYGTDVMTSSEINYRLRDISRADDAAGALISGARKNDDRTVVVAAFS